MKKVPLKPLRLTRQPIRVLGPQDLTRVGGGSPTTTTSNACEGKPTGGTEAQENTCA